MRQKWAVPVPQDKNIISGHSSDLQLIRCVFEQNKLFRVTSNVSEQTVEGPEKGRLS